MDAVALKKNGQWSFFNPETSKLLFDKKADTINLLIDLWLNRKEE
jgi:hypothetical protein